MVSNRSFSNFQASLFFDVNRQHLCKLLYTLVLTPFGPAVFPVFMSFSVSITAFTDTFHMAFHFFQHSTIHFIYFPHSTASVHTASTFPSCPLDSLLISIFTTNA